MKFRQAHYMAIFHLLLLFCAEKYIACALIIAFLGLGSLMEVKVHNHGHSADYWMFQVEFLERKVNVVSTELAEWRKKKYQEKARGDQLKRNQRNKVVRMTRCEVHRKWIQNNNFERKFAMEILPEEVSKKYFSKNYKQSGHNQTF